jgi:replicative DNA helicase
LKYADVVYITIEMPARQLENRFWCNLAKVDYEKFRKYTLSKEEKRKLKKKAKRYEKHQNKFEMADFYGGCTVDNLMAHLAKLFDDKNMNIKLVCIDYMNIISIDGKGVQLDWESQVQIAMNLKQKIARQFEVPTWSACQLTGDSVAFGTHIKDNIDIGVMLECDEDSDETGLIKVTYPKARDFRGIPHYIRTRRNFMRLS